MNISPSPWTPTTYPIPGSNPAPLETPQIDTPVLNRKKRGVADKDALWPQHSTIRVSLLGMTEEQKNFTKKQICKWAPHINLCIQFTDRPDGHIRIKADNNIIGGYSDIGKDSASDEEASMVVGFRDGLNAFAGGTITHEFGHALGLRHEHQHPDTNLDFNPKLIHERAVKSIPDVTLEEVKVNVIGKLPRDTVITSPYDRNSIMHYKFSKEELNGGEPVPEINELSEKDIKFISSLYPKVYCPPCRRSGFGFFPPPTV